MISFDNRSGESEELKEYKIMQKGHARYEAVVEV